MLTTTHPLSSIERCDGILVMNFDGDITYLDKAARGFLDIRIDDSSSINLYELISRQKKFTMIQQIMNGIQHKKEIYFELEWGMENKKIGVQLHPSPDGATLLLTEVATAKIIGQSLKVDYHKFMILSEAANHLLYKENPKEILDAVFKELADYLDLDVYFNYFYEEQSNTLRLMNFFGISEQTAKDIEYLQMGEAVCGLVAQTCQRVVAEDIQSSIEDRVELIKSFGIKTYVCHPLISYGKLIGTLSFGSSKRSHFSEDEVDIIQTICNHFCTVLERTFLISELKNKKEEAEKAVLAKTNFLSMMSHELRTPLNSILGFTQILDTDSEDPLTAGQKDKIEKISKAGKHLLTMVNDLLGLAKMEADQTNVQLNNLNISDILDDSLKMISPLANKKRVTIQNRIPHSELNVIANKKRLYHVFSNLLSNAVKYTYENGEIVIDGQLDENYLRVFIQDTGIGIPTCEQENIFIPFYRIFNSDMNIEGTGIGLSLVKQFIHEMNGKVGVISTPGKGSSFWFTLPLKPLQNL